MLSLDWTAPATDLHDALVAHYCEEHPDYNPEADAFDAANTYADEMIARHAE